MQNLGSFRPLGAILGAPSHTKRDFAIPLICWTLLAFSRRGKLVKRNLQVQNLVAQVGKNTVNLLVYLVIACKTIA